MKRVIRGEFSMNGRNSAGKTRNKSKLDLEGQRNESFKPFATSFERKWQEVDWSQSVLDVYASQNVMEFNSTRDSSVFSAYEIEDLLRKVDFGDSWDMIYSKAVKTLDKLSQELCLAKGSFALPIKAVEHVEIVLKECNKMFRARALVIKILSLIHKREDLLLKIMRFDEESQDLLNCYEILTDVSQDVLQTIGFLSQTGLNIGEFLYLGGNYAQKVMQDDANLKELFPGLKSIDYP
jgi:hypothetical protein